MQFQNLSIIVPVYNEEATLLNVLKKLAFLINIFSKLDIVLLILSIQGFA